MWRRKLPRTAGTATAESKAVREGRSVKWRLMAPAVPEAVLTHLPPDTIRDLSAVTPYKDFAMVLCPIAIAVGCRKCPIFKICPVKSLIGDYQQEASAPPKAATGAKRGKDGAKRA